MKPGDFRVGEWLVQPSLNRVQRDGRLLHLRPKTMQVLVELAEHAGDVVSREDLQSRVWRDVHVSEESLSHCIVEIRSVLGDDAKGPTYVETVAKHGYRLIAPVSPAPSPDAGAGTAKDADGGRQRLSSGTALRVALLVGIAGALVAAVAIGIRWFKPPPAGGAHLVVLADWENRTGDPVFDDTLRQAMSVALGETKHIRTVSRERAAHALRLMRQSPGARVAGQVARQVCRRVGADMVVGGDIAKVGEQFVLIAEATLCSSGTPIAQAQATAEGKDRVLAALNRVAAGLRDDLGEAPAHAGNAATRVEEVTTADLDALQAFTLANDALAQRKVMEAITLYTHAIDIDPGFALAHSRLGSTLGGLREWKRANQHRKRAVELAAGLTERERLYVNATFKLGQGRAAEAEEILKAWAKLYPDDRVPLGWLAVSHLNRGERAQALSWGQAAVKIDPAPGTLVNLGAVYLNLGRLADARSVTAGLNEPGFLYLLAFLDGETSEMERQASAVAPGSVEELDMRAREAQAAMATGRLRAGRQLVGRAETLGLQLGLLELTSQVLATQALWEAEVGDQRLAVEMAAAALSMSENSSTRALAVLAFARAGAVSRAGALLKRIESGPVDLDPAVAAGCRRKLAAAVALASNRPADAIEALGALHPYEDGGVINHVALRGDLAELGVHHLRGLARLALGQGAEAAVEFQRIIDQRGVSPLSPYYALASLNLARAHALAGDRAAAQKDYEVFLARWSGADSDVALLAEVKREYRRVAAPEAGGSK